MDFNKYLKQTVIIAVTIINLKIIIIIIIELVKLKKIVIINYFNFIRKNFKDFSY